MHGLVLLFPATQSYELMISRIKRGEVELIMVSCILLTSPVWSVPPLQEHQCWLPYIPDPSTVSFHPWSNRDAPENVWRRAQSFLFTQPRGVPTACCWAGGRQFTLCGASSVSIPSRVCSSRVMVVHQGHLACTTIQRGVPFAGAMRKSWYWWRTYECPVCWFFVRYKGTPSATWVFLLHTVPPPTGPSLSSSPCRYQLDTSYFLFE